MFKFGAKDGEGDALRAWRELGGDSGHVMTLVQKFGGAAIVVAATIVLSCSFSIHHLYANQLSYYVPYLCHFYPENFKADWCANLGSTHVVFSHLLITVGNALNLMSISIVGVFVCWLMIATGLYLLCQSLYPERSGSAFIITIAFLIAFGPPGLGGMHIGASSYFISTFEPYFLGSAISVLAIGFFSQNRYLACGLLLGLGMWIHIHISFLVLSIVTTFLFLETRSGLKRSIGLLAPVIGLGLPLVCFTVYRYGLLEPSAGSVPTWRIWADFRNPHHSHAWIWWLSPETRRWAGICLLQSGALLCLRPYSACMRKMVLVIGTIATMTLTAALATILLRSSWLGRFEIWHISPFVTLLGWVFVGGILARVCSFEPLDLSYSTLGIGGILVASGIMMIGTASMAHAMGLVVWAIGVIIFGVLYSLVGFSLPWKRIVTGLIAISLLGICANYARHGLATSNVFGNEERIENIPVLKWVRENTPKQSVFLVPFSFEQFRAGARRSIVIDYKLIPFGSSCLEAWYHRISSVSELVAPETMKQAEEAYNRLDATSLNELSRKWRFQYVVINIKEHSGSLAELPQVYRDGAFAVYCLTGKQDI